MDSSGIPPTTEHNPETQRQIMSKFRLNLSTLGAFIMLMVIIGLQFFNFSSESRITYSDEIYYPDNPEVCVGGTLTYTSTIAIQVRNAPLILEQIVTITNVGQNRRTVAYRPSLTPYFLRFDNTDLSFPNRWKIDDQFKHIQEGRLESYIFEPGEYELNVALRDRQTSSTAGYYVPFTVVECQ